MERNDRCFCGSGIKYKKCHYRINGESKLANIYRAYNEYNNACIQKGICNNCRKGCSQCCNDYFFISESEFLQILEELIYRKININDYISKAKAVKKHIEKFHPEIIKKLNKFMPKSVDNIDESFFKDSINPPDLPACIFLDNNKCSIYNVRPSICRGYGTTEKCRIIKNKKYDFEEKYKMYNEASIISHSGDTTKSILKRTYPLFYWFAYFLDDSWYNFTMEKLRRIRDDKNDAYYDFTRKLQ